LNQTQIELDKIQEARIVRKRRGDNRPYVHAYDKGFLANWTELLFPPRAEKHRRMNYDKEFARQQKENEQEMRSEKRETTKRRGK
jgi:hypothetical protein